jgi:hypothetical protein
MLPLPEQHAVGKKKILAVGEDFALLATRAALLAKTNASVTCCNSVEFATELNRDRFDLVILCYSLGESVRQTISVDVHLRWPKARVLQITADPFPIPPLGDQVDAVTGSMQPAQFVRAAMLLLTDSPILPPCKSSVEASLKPTS